MLVQKDREVNGLFVRKGKRGDRYVYARNVKGKMVRASLGSCEDHTLQDARRWAANLNLDGTGKARSFTLGEVAEAAVRRATLKKRRVPNYLLYWVRLHASDWLSRPLGDITKAMISDRHDAIAKSSPVSAARFVIVLRTLYSFADRNLDYAGRNNAKGVETIPARPRQVVWTQEQLQAFLAACDDEYWHCFFTVLIYTGMRRGNVCSMEWGEIANDVWIIPASKFKTGIEHRVHLRSEVTAALARRKNGSPYVFPSPALPDKPLTDPYGQFQAICKRAGVAGVTIHDLRRTLGSRLAARVPLPVVAKILGHRTINTTMRSYAVIADDVAKAALNAL